jgi:hypothetical protein
MDDGNYTPCLTIQEDMANHDDMMARVLRSCTPDRSDYTYSLAQHQAWEKEEASRQFQAEADRQYQVSALEKPETPTESYNRISASKRVKEVKAVKSAAKKLVKKKKLKQLTVLFSKK